MIGLGEVLEQFERQNTNIRYHYPNMKRRQKEKKKLRVKSIQMRLKAFWMCLQDKTSENNYPHWSGDYFLV